MHGRGGRGRGRGRGRDGGWQGGGHGGDYGPGMMGGPMAGGPMAGGHMMGPGGPMGGPPGGMMGGGGGFGGPHAGMGGGMGMMPGMGAMGGGGFGGPQGMMGGMGMMQGGGPPGMGPGPMMRPPPPPMGGGMMGDRQGSGAGPGGGFGPGPGPDTTGGLGPDRPGSAGAAAGMPDMPPVNRPVVKKQNDYCQHFVDTGARPQNFLRDSVLEDRYEDYPQLQRLIQLKDKQVRDYATPAYGLRADLKKLKLSKDLFGTKFDVILIDPPWEEYVRRAPGLVSDAEVWTWQDIQDLDIDAIADTPSVVFLWCGSAEGLDGGRHCLRRWGFRRSEDICWIKTNKEHKSRKYLIPTYQQQGSMLVHTKEHCLMGIRGKLKRSIDGHIIHTNVDTDVIVSEEPALGSTEKPEELYNVIERFCAGRRRLELFGEDHNMREGWVTVGKQISQTNFKKQLYLNHFRNEDGVPYDEHRGAKPPPGVPVLIPSTAEIEELRPRSPPHFSGPGRGRGR